VDVPALGTGFKCKCPPSFILDGTVCVPCVSVVDGNGTAGFSGDGGPATQATLNEPTGVALDAAGNLYISHLVTGELNKNSEVSSIMCGFFYTDATKWHAVAWPSASVAGMPLGCKL
jgi:hypothetical protein